MAKQKVKDAMIRSVKVAVLIGAYECLSLQVEEDEIQLDDYIEDKQIRSRERLGQRLNFLINRVSELLDKYIAREVGDSTNQE